MKISIYPTRKGPIYLYDGDGHVHLRAETVIQFVSLTQHILSLKFFKVNAHTCPESNIYSFHNPGSHFFFPRDPSFYDKNKNKNTVFVPVLAERRTDEVIVSMATRMSLLFWSGPTQLSKDFSSR